MKDLFMSKGTHEELAMHYKTLIVIFSNVLQHFTQAIFGLDMQWVNDLSLKFPKKVDK